MTLALLAGRCLEPKIVPVVESNFTNVAGTVHWSDVTVVHRFLCCKMRFCMEVPLLHGTRLRPFVSLRNLTVLGGRAGYTQVCFWQCDEGQRFAGHRASHGRPGSTYTWLQAVSGPLYPFSAVSFVCIRLTPKFPSLMTNISSVKKYILQNTVGTTVSRRRGYWLCQLMIGSLSVWKGFLSVVFGSHEIPSVEG